MFAFLGQQAQLDSAALLSEGGIDVDLDLSVFVQVGLFVLLLVVLKPILFDPMLKLFEEREKKIEGARAESRRIDNASADAQQTYETAMQKARTSANAERDRLRSEGTKTEADILAKVREEIGKTVDAGRITLATDAKAAREQLGSTTPELARELASRLLGREVA